MENEAKDLNRLFPQGRVPVVLSSILQTGSTLRKKTEKDREDWITRRLYERLIKIPVYRDGPLDIRMQAEIPSPEPDSNYPGGRIDILVSCARGVEIYFAIEAKRLRVRSSKGARVSGDNAYVMDGMMRFVDGQYAPLMEAGAMLGYVFDGKIDIARSDIDRIVQSKSTELKLKSPKQLIRSKILPNAPIDETHHLLSRSSFIIYHILLAV